MILGGEEGSCLGRQTQAGAARAGASLSVSRRTFLLPLPLRVENRVDEGYKAALSGLPKVLLEHACPEPRHLGVAVPLQPSNLQPLPYRLIPGPSSTYKGLQLGGTGGFQNWHLLLSCVAWAEVSLSPCSPSSSGR